MKYVSRANLTGILTFTALLVALTVWSIWFRTVERHPDSFAATVECDVDPGVSRDLGPPVAGFAFEDIATSLGVNFEYFRGDTGQLWTIEPHGGGVACFDLNGDDQQDLFFVNGKQLPPDPSDATHVCRVYRNHSPDGFQDVTHATGLAISLYGQGCSAADFDNDGFQDLLVTGWQQCVLFRNNGDGSFRNITAESGISGGKWNTGACFADFDRDGDLDLFIANYLDFDPAAHKPCISKELRIGYCGPHHYGALDDFLYGNNGDGQFEDASMAAGILLPRGPGFGGVAADVDNDGWPDLFVANDAEANYMLHNRAFDSPTHRFRFTDVAMEWGVALNANGLPEANMGIACADFDGNGLLDFGISHFYQEHFTLYQNLGSRGFQDVTQPCGLDFTTRSKMGWGTGFVDFDADGWLDLFIVNGHINDYPDHGMPYRMTAQVFRNRRGNRFVDVSAESGSYFQEPRIARGTAVGDLDGDGHPELIIVQHHAPASILTNRSDTGRVLGLRLVGSLSTRDATNGRAIVTLRAASEDGSDRQLLRECIAGEGYLGSNDKRLWFGVGDRQQVDRLEVRWSSGRVDFFSDLPTSHEYLLIEGQPLRTIRRYEIPKEFGINPAVNGRPTRERGDLRHFPRLRIGVTLRSDWQTHSCVGPLSDISTGAAASRTR